MTKVMGAMANPSFGGTILVIIFRPPFDFAGIVIMSSCAAHLAAVHEGQPTLLRSLASVSLSPENATLIAHFVEDRNSRRRIFPMFDFGKFSRNSTILGTL
jgi:hypothetical protein